MIVIICKLRIMFRFIVKVELIGQISLDFVLTKMLSKKTKLALLSGQCFFSCFVLYKLHNSCQIVPDLQVFANHFYHILTFIKRLDYSNVFSAEAPEARAKKDVFRKRVA